MPTRSLTWIIIVFWVGMTAWLTYREIWPWLGPEQPPPFTIDLADEAQNNMPVRWSVFLNGEDRGYSRNWVNFRERDDTFELVGEFKLWNVSLIGKSLKIKKSEVKEGQPDFVIKSMYRVTREGALRALQASVTFNLKVLTSLVDELEVLHLSGEVRDQQFYPHVSINVPLFLKMERDLEPVPMARQASLMNPLQPVNRLANLRKGQHWRIPIVDPLTSAWQRSAKIQFLNAQVLPETQPLKWGTNKNEVPCLVIEYEGEEITGHTWVQESDGLVVLQEIQQHGETMKLLRD
jgi:hypothetical protein